MTERRSITWERASQLRRFFPSQIVKAAAIAVLFAVVVSGLSFGAPESSDLGEAFQGLLGWPLHALQYLLRIVSPKAAETASRASDLHWVRPFEAFAVCFALVFGALLFPPRRWSAPSVIDYLWPSFPDALDDGIDLADASDLDPRSQAHRFEGRQAELSRLRTFASENPNARSLWTTIEGAQGVGKTRLAIEFARLLRSHGWDVGILKPGMTLLQLRGFRLRKDTAILVDADLTGALSDTEEFWSNLSVLLHAKPLPTLAFRQRSVRMRILLIGENIPVMSEFVSGTLAAGLSDTRSASAVRLEGFSEEDAKRAFPNLSTEAIREVQGRPLFLLLGGTRQDCRKELRKRALRRVSLCANELDKAALLLAALGGPLRRTRSMSVLVTGDVPRLRQLFEGQSASVVAQWVPAIVPKSFAAELIWILTVGEHALSRDRIDAVLDIVLEVPERLLQTLQNLALSLDGTDRLEIYKGFVAAFEKTETGRHRKEQLPALLETKISQTGIILDEASATSRRELMPDAPLDQADLERRFRLIFADIDSHEGDPRLVELTARALANAATFQAKLSNVDRAKEYADEARAVWDKSPNNTALAREALRALGAVLNAVCRTGDRPQAEACVNEMERGAKASGALSLFASTMSNAYQNMMALYQRDAKRSADAGALPRRLRDLTDRIRDLRSLAPDDWEVAYNEANAISVMIAHSASSGDMAGGELYVPRLRALMSLAARFPVLFLPVAGSLRNAAVGYYHVKDWNGFVRHAAELKRFLDYFADRSIARHFCALSTITIRFCGERGDLDEIEVWGDSIWKLAGEHRADSELIGSVALAARNALVIYSNAGKQHGEVYRRWKSRLASLALAYPNYSEVQENAARFGITFSDQIAARTAFR